MGHDLAGMSSAPGRRRLVAILNADGVGYSRLMARDEVGTSERMAVYRDAMSAKVRTHGGRVVDAVGDNLLAEFGSVVDSVACAVEIQRDLSERNEPLDPDRRLAFRIGIHLGDVLVEGERLVGDGVNIAARLEQLSDAGGICLSRAAFDQVEGKLPLQVEDLGERELKNIPRPIGVYRVTPPQSSEGADAPALTGSAERTVPGFSGLPALAVLAFDNLSGDPEQEYFSDGITDELISRLSRLWMPVIGRNSSFAYKGRPVDLKQLGRELGVRYVVEGSVRRAGERVRVTAQLVDATTGHHVWSDRYDRRLADVFEVQDEITEAIAGAMPSDLMRFEAARAARAQVENLDAWDHTIRGYGYLFKVTREDNALARRHGERAAELDPRMGTAFAVQAGAHFYDVYSGWSDDPGRPIRRGHLVRQAIAGASGSGLRPPRRRGLLRLPGAPRRGAQSAGGRMSTAARLQHRALPAHLRDGGPGMGRPLRRGPEQGGRGGVTSSAVAVAATPAMGSDTRLVPGLENTELTLNDSSDSWRGGRDSNPQLPA